MGNEATRYRNRLEKKVLRTPRNIRDAGRPVSTFQQDLTRLLILDIHQFFTEFARGLFVDSGCRISLATTRREALVALVKDPFDTFLVSISAARNEDIEFVRMVTSFVPWVQIIVVTESSGTSLTQLRAAGADMVMNRSVSYARLGAAIRKLREVKSSEKMPISLTITEHQFLLRYIFDGLQAALQTTSLSESIPAALTRIATCLNLRAGAVLEWAGEYPLLTVLIPGSMTNNAPIEPIRETMIAHGRSLNDDKVNWAELEIAISPSEAFRPGTLSETQDDAILVPCFSRDQISGILAVYPEHNLNDDENFLLHQLSVQLGRFSDTVDCIRQQAMHDSLTGLLNRLYLEDYLEKTFQTSFRYKRVFSLVLLDLDHFKRVNDRYGHVIGDAVLKEVADLLVSEARRADVVGRYGGEEFLVVLPHTDSHGARMFSHRLLAAIRRHDFCSSGQKLSLTASIGVVTFDPISPEAGNLRSTDLLIQADSALYAAKDRGRDRAVKWPELREFALPGQPDEPIAVFPPDAGADEGGSTSLVLPRILLVDDERSICLSLSRLLNKKGYDVVTADSAAGALELLKNASQPIEVLITDLNMPGIDGIELIRRVATLSPGTISVVMTGAATVEYAVESVRNGVFAFLEKPVQLRDLLDVLGRIEEQRLEQQANSAYHERLEHTVEEQNRRLQLTVEKVQESYQFTLEAMVDLLDAREPDSCLHSVRVRELTRIMGKELGLTGEDLDTLDKGALLHDIGKIGIPDSVLLKHGPLTESEWDIMRQHPTIGYRIVQKAPWQVPVAEIIYSHHERFDGSGYPRGLAGTSICLGARIFTIVDVYDAIRSPRIYKESRPLEDAVREIQEGRGTFFDPDLVDVFMSCLDAINDTWEQQSQQGSITWV